MEPRFTRIKFLLILSWIKFWFVFVFSKYLNKLYLILKGSVSFLYVTIYPCVLGTREKHVSSSVLFQAQLPYYRQLNLCVFVYGICVIF
jgi:hypothetical protein